MARTPALIAGRLVGACTPPTAAEGCYGLTPQDLHRAYALPATAPSVQTIAVVDAYDDPSAEADLKVFDEELHLPACTTANGCFTKLNENGNSGPLPEPRGEWAAEISLDIEAAHAICQNCHILLVEASAETFPSLSTAEETAARMGATEISNSWESEEPLTDSSVFNHPGVVITAASGDNGYLNWQSLNPAAIGHVTYPASSPHVVAVGGTRLSLTSEGEWAGESVWNGLGATGSGCSERFEAPPWQRELPNWSAVGCGTKRAVGDVSADADPYTGIAVYDSTPMGGGQGPPGWGTLAGTSLASPVIAATFALAGGGEVEYPAKTLYESERKLPGSLHDVESGSNGRCDRGPNPETGLSGCSTQEEAADCKSDAVCLAGPGYDGPSGVGTPDGLAGFMSPSNTAKQTQTIEFTSLAPSSAVVGGQTYTVAAIASSGLPVSLASGTLSVCSLAGSTVSFVAAGTCTIDANQPGNPNYNPAPEARQSFAVDSPSAPMPPTTPGATTAAPAPPLLAPPFTPAPDSNFSLRGHPTVNRRTGAITFRASVTNPGTFTWLLTFPNGTFGAFSASNSKCSAGDITLKGKCRPARVVFAKSALSVGAAAGSSVPVTFTVSPSSSARKALGSALARGRALPVTARLSFQSSLGGASVSHTYSIAARLAKATRARQK